LKTKLLTLGIIECFVAFLAIPSGIALITDPTGASLGLASDILSSSPFRSYFVPGIFLFIGNGLFQLFGAMVSFNKSQKAGFIGIGVALFLILWILIQVYYIGWIVFLQPLLLTIGIIELLIALKISIKQGNHK